MSKLVQQLPSLEQGVNLLKSEKRVDFHRLALSHLLSNPGEAYWIDARNNSSTYTLHQLTPEKEVLDRMQIARAFTAYQHHTLVEQLIIQLDDRAELVLLPYLTSLYEDDELGRGEALDLLGDTLDNINVIAEDLDLTVLVSIPDSTTPEMQGLVRDHVTNQVEARQTREGTRYRSDGFQSKVFPTDGGLQTTWNYWKDILGENRTVEERFLERVEMVGTY